MDEAKLNQANEEVNKLTSLGKKELFYGSPTAGSSLSSQAAPIKGPKNQEVGVTGESLTYQAPSVTDPNARIGDYVLQGGVAKVVPSSPTDIVQKYVTSNAKTLGEIANLDWSEVASTGALAALGFPTNYDNLPAMGATSAVGALMNTTGVGRVLWTGASMLDAYNRKMLPALETYYNQDFNYELAGEMAQDANGNVVFKPNYKKMLGAGPESGSAVKSALDNTNTSVQMLGDNRLGITVSPAFAESSEYQAILNKIKENYPTLSTDQANTVVDDDTGKTLLQTIENVISSTETNYLFNAQAVALMKETAPTASDKSLNIGADIMRTAYFPEKMLAEASINVYDKDNNLIDINARDYYDSILAMNKLERQDYMTRLGNRIESSEVSDDEKAILYAQSRALYAISDQEGAYQGLYTLDFWDDIGQKWFNDDSLSTFKDNGVFSGFISVAGTIGKGITLSKVTNGVEEVARGLTPGISEWAGKGGALQATKQALGEADGVSGADISKALAKAGAKTATQVGYQLVADAVYDLGQLVPYAITDNLDNYNFLEMLGQDFFFDMLMTYGPRAFVSGVNTPEYEYRVAVEDMKTGEIEYKRLKDIKGDDNFRIITDETGIRDAQLVEVTSEELAQRRAEMFDKWNDSKIALKVQTLVTDENAATGKLATQLRAKGDTFLFRKLLRLGNIKVATADTRAEYLNKPEVKENWDNLRAVYKETASSIRQRLSKEDIRYINASANEYRFLKKAEGDTEAEAKIRSFYKEAKEGVSSDRAAQLDNLLTAMRAVAGDVLDFYVEKGLMAQEAVDELRARPEYVGGMYMPVYTKGGVSAGGEIKQSRALMKAIRNGSALISVDDLDHPLNSISRYIDGAMRAVALNDKAMAIREAAIMNGNGIHVVSDTGLSTRDVKNMRELDAEFKKGTNAIAMKVRKALPTQKQWQDTNNKLVLRSKALKEAQALAVLKQEENKLRRDYNTAKRENNGSKKSQIDIANRAIAISNNKQAQLTKIDDIKKYLKNVMERAQEAHKGSDAKLDINSYLNVQATNALKQALKSKDFEGEIQMVINRAVEDANPWIDPSDVIASKWEAYFARYRRTLNDKLQTKNPTKGDELNALADKVMDKVTEKLTSEKPMEVTFIDEEGMPTKMMDNYGQNNVIRYKINGEVQEMVLSGIGASELVHEFYRPEFVAPSTTFGKIRGRVKGVLNHMAQAKRYLTTSADITRMLPNIMRDFSRGIVSTGGVILLSPEKMMEELKTKYGYDDATMKRIDDGLLLTREAIDTSTLNASLAVPRKNREKAMVRAMTEPDGNAFVRFIYDLKGVATGDMTSLGKILARPQDFGESLTRKRAMDTAYAKEMADSQAKGLSVDQSIKRAMEASWFAGREATVNFQRKGEYISTLAQQVPYLTQRFATLESFKYTYLNDPIAFTNALKATVTSYTALIAVALANEESRQKYFLLTEYDRANNIIIPLDKGAIITIPLDDTIAAFLTPYRRMVETMNGVDPTSFFLCFAEALGALSPADLSGFSEGDKFNIVRGFEKLGSEFIPTWAQPIIESLRGRSLYYGSNLSIDSDYTGAYYDNWAPTPGQLTTKSKNSQTLAAIADNTGIPQWVLQNFVSQYGGNLAQYLLNTIDKLAGATEEAQGGKEWADSLFKPFTGVDSNQAEAAFYDAINQLKVEKSKVQKEIATITQKVNGAAGETKAKLLEERQKKINDYGTQVTDVLNQYLSAYELTGGLSKKQANQAWYLYMLYDQDQLQRDIQLEDSTGDYYTDKERAYNNKQATNLAAASGLDTLVRSPVSAYNDTYAEGAFMNTVYGDTTKYIANIERVLKDNDISRYNMYQDYYGKIGSNSSSADKKKAKAAWNAKVVTLLEPYVNEVGIDNLLSQRKVVDYLDEVLFIDNPYKTKEYLKTIFGE